MTLEGAAQAKAKGIDVNDPVQRAIWRAKCLLHNRRSPHIERQAQPWSDEQEARHQQMCAGMIKAACLRRPIDA